MQSRGRGAVVGAEYITKISSALREGASRGGKNFETANSSGDRCLFSSRRVSLACFPLARKIPPRRNKYFLAKLLESKVLFSLSFSLFFFVLTSSCTLLDEKEVKSRDFIPSNFLSSNFSSSRSFYFFPFFALSEVRIRECTTEYKSLYCLQ